MYNASDCQRGALVSVVLCLGACARRVPMIMCALGMRSDTRAD